MIILNMNLFALFSKLYYVTKNHIILDLLFYNYLYSSKFTILQLWEFNNMYGIHFTYGSYGSKLTNNLQFYNFTIFTILIKLNHDNTYNYDYNFTISQYNYNYNYNHDTYNYNSILQIYKIYNFNKIESWQYRQLPLQFYNFTIQLQLQLQFYKYFTKNYNHDAYNYNYNFTILQIYKFYNFNKIESWQYIQL